MHLCFSGSAGSLAAVAATETFRRFPKQENSNHILHERDKGSGEIISINALHLSAKNIYSF
jgi:hypothetical protein